MGIERFTPSMLHHNMVAKAVHLKVYFAHYAGINRQYWRAGSHTKVKAIVSFQRDAIVFELGVVIGPCTPTQGEVMVACEWFADADGIRHRLWRQEAHAVRPSYGHPSTDRLVRGCDSADPTPNEFISQPRTTG